MEINPEKLDEIKNSTEIFYKFLGEVYCPYFRDKIHFNSIGFEHLNYKSGKKPRKDAELYIRNKLFKYVPEILKTSHTLQGIYETKSFEKLKIHGRADLVLQDITYYEFIAVVDKFRIKVLIKQISNGVKFFWSVIPLWKMNRSTNTRILNGGIFENE